jgi:hypothetical protein
MAKGNFTHMWTQAVNCRWISMKTNETWQPHTISTKCGLDKIDAHYPMVDHHLAHFLVAINWISFLHFSGQTQVNHWTGCNLQETMALVWFSHFSHWVWAMGLSIGFLQKFSNSGTTHSMCSCHSQLPPWRQRCVQRSFTASDSCTATPAPSGI